MSCTCNGAKHVYNEQSGSWEACICLLIEERNRRCAMAAIPREYWELTIDSLEAFSPQLKQVKLWLKNFISWYRKEELPAHLRQIVISGHVVSAKVLLYLTVKAVLLQTTSRVTSLDQMTTLLLTDRGQYEAVRELRFLGLFLGDEYTQPIHKHVLKNIMEHRAEPRFVTVWATSHPVAGLQQVYGQMLAWQRADSIVTVSEEVRL